MYHDELQMYSGNVARERVTKPNLFCLAVERGPCQLHEFLRLFSCSFGMFHRQQDLQDLDNFRHYLFAHSPSKLKLFSSIIFFLLFLAVFCTGHISNVSIHIQHPHAQNPGQTKRGYHPTPALW